MTSGLWLSPCRGGNCPPLCAYGDRTLGTCSFRCRRYWLGICKASSPRRDPGRAHCPHPMGIPSGVILKLSCVAVLLVTDGCLSLNPPLTRTTFQPSDTHCPVLVNRLFGGVGARHVNAAEKERPHFVSRSFPGSPFPQPLPPWGPRHGWQ